uniref:Uncharacterized protein n=1 Tax=Romanomermis culicivorax TaxID=13658 RepID=A0A915KW87_ROMCU
MCGSSSALSDIGAPLRWIVQLSACETQLSVSITQPSANAAASGWTQSPEGETQLSAKETQPSAKETQQSGSEALLPLKVAQFKGSFILAFFGGTERTIDTTLPNEREIFVHSVG